MFSTNLYRFQQLRRFPSDVHPRFGTKTTIIRQPFRCAYISRVLVASPAMSHTYLTVNVTCLNCHKTTFLSIVTCVSKPNYQAITHTSLPEAPAIIRGLTSSVCSDTYMQLPIVLVNKKKRCCCQLLSSPALCETRFQISFSTTIETSSGFFFLKKIREQKLKDVHNKHLLTYCAH